jgi:hypothetical protein
MKRAIENIQRASQLLGLHDRELPRPHVTMVHSARANLFNACALLELHPDRPEIRSSVIELLLKAELALAAVDMADVNLSFRVAEQLVLDTRVRIEALTAEGR